MRALRASLCVAALAGASCRKVPLYDVNAAFDVADAAWFENEETLFVFYDVTAEQGIGEPSVIELTYTTDDERVDWTPIDAFEPVHTHVPVDCGDKSLCGSMSIHVAKEPRDVHLRLRYHREGELALEPRTVFNVIGVGPPHSHRSLIVYGVFDETNSWIQWRGRHLFPTIRNQDAEALGLRRDVTIEDQEYGSATLGSAQNPYAYGASCRGDFVGAALEPLSFNERAAFNAEQVPVEAGASSVVCAQATVTDATGTFTTTAVAKKNPETRSAFPELRSPIHEARRVNFFLAPCREEISAEHEAMQRQRLFMEDEPTYCLDDWAAQGFVERLAEDMQDAVEAERAYGEDMVLVVGLHRDEAGAARAVEQALALVVPDERHRNTPRLAGAFVYDSSARSIADSSLTPTTLWCPASLNSLGASLTCAVAPDIPELNLGPLSVSFLPILPTRDEYLDFLETYSERQAGSILTSAFLTPEFSAQAEHYDLGDFGFVSFFNDEVFTADADDAFSYCTVDEGMFFLFRSELMQNEELLAQAEALCEQDPSNPLCAVLEAGALPIELLPTWHQSIPETSYELGIFWDFPFLLRAEYESYVAGAVSAFSFSVPFGVRVEGEGYYGSYMWTQDTFPMERMLAHCRRFCDHPVFDRAEVYQVRQKFSPDYANTCYRPAFPEPGDGGFPLDP
ncbi:MAG: hypothetical protein H6740_10695 [Alphaproteobacteria bacterium]|nr:hypothetical protein [Alphaproteobacteria bacterium]